MLLITICTPEDVPTTNLSNTAKTNGYMSASFVQLKFQPVIKGFVWHPVP